MLAKRNFHLRHDITQRKNEDLRSPSDALKNKIYTVGYMSTLHLYNLIMSDPSTEKSNFILTIYV